MAGMYMGNRLELPGEEGEYMKRNGITGLLAGCTIKRHLLALGISSLLCRKGGYSFPCKRIVPDTIEKQGRHQGCDLTRPNVST